MSVANNKTQDLYRWVEKAEHDLITATFTLKITDDCPCDTICFHAQQCAEKYFKGLLFWLDIDFPKTHDVRILIQLLPRSVSKLLDTHDVLTLNRYAIETR